MERGGPELPGTFLCPFLSKPGKKPWEAWGVLRLGKRSSELGALPRASQLGTPGGVGTWGGRRRPGLILVLSCLLGPLRKEKQSCFQFLQWKHTRTPSPNSRTKCVYFSNRASLLSPAVPRAVFSTDLLSYQESQGYSQWTLVDCGLSLLLRVWAQAIWAVVKMSVLRIGVLGFGTQLWLLT